MIYGLYLSAQGLEAQSVRQDIIANNLANASTNAFKRDLAVFQSHRPFDVEEGADRQLPGGVLEQTGGVSLAAVLTDYSNGALETTGGDLDLALAGPGFLRVTDGKQEYLTRDGRLEIDRQGNLVTRGEGYAVLGAAGGPLVATPNAGPLEITAEGLVTQAGGTIRLGQFALGEPADYLELEKVGDNLFRTSGKVIPAVRGVQVKQGNLEVSGTRPVVEMIEMIESSRALEANANMIKYQDESLGRLLQSLPRQ